MWGELTSKASVLPVYEVTPAARAGGRPDGETHGRRQVLPDGAGPGAARPREPGGTGCGLRGRQSSAFRDRAGRQRPRPASSLRAGSAERSRIRPHRRAEG